MVDLVHLRRGGVSVVLCERNDALPAVVHWGADLGDGPLDGLLALVTPALGHSALDTPVLTGLLPEYARGFAGRPGLEVLRNARGPSWSVAFRDVSLAVNGATLRVRAADADLGVSLRTELVLEHSGLLRPATG